MILRKVGGRVRREAEGRDRLSSQLENVANDPRSIFTSETKNAVPDKRPKDPLDIQQD